MMPLLGKASLKPHVERAHRAARFWGEMSLIRHSANSFFVLSVGCGKVGLYIFPFSQSGSSIGLSICPSVDVSQSNLYPALKSHVVGTHQGAVVHKSRGDVAVEGERQDLSFSRTESHFVL